MDETEQRIKLSKALIPLKPVSPQVIDQLTQWPMVNLRAREAEHAAKMFARQKVLDESKADEVFFEASSSTNKEVANILDDNAQNQTEKTKVETKVTIDEAAWGEDDDLDIDDEINANAGGDDILDNGSGAADNDIFVPPSPGADPVQALLR